VANSEGRLFATATAAMTDFVLEVCLEKRKGEQTALRLYKAEETKKDGPRLGLLENKSRPTVVLTATVMCTEFRNLRMIEFCTSPTSYLIVISILPYGSSCSNLIRPFVERTRQ